MAALKIIFSDDSVEKFNLFKFSTRAEELNNTNPSGVVTKGQILLRTR